MRCSLTRLAWLLLERESRRRDTGDATKRKWGADPSRNYHPRLARREVGCIAVWKQLVSCVISGESPIMHMALSHPMVCLGHSASAICLHPCDWHGKGKLPSANNVHGINFQDQCEQNAGKISGSQFRASIAQKWCDIGCCAQFIYQVSEHCEGNLDD